MKILRRTIRKILLENLLAVENETMLKKLRKQADNYKPPEGWQILDTQVSEEGDSLYVQLRLNGSRQSLINFSSQQVKSDLSNLYLEFAKRRGWNLLRITDQPMPSREPIVMMTLKFDKQPNPKNTNYFMNTQDLQIKEHVLLHLTKAKYLPSIKKSGFKPAKTSSDGVNFGNGRAYFVACSRMDWEDSRDFAIGWFTKASESDGFAGIDPTEKQALLVIDPEKLRNNIKFYVDTEFGYGTGAIGYSSVWGGKAIWTPGHIRANAIEEIITL